MNWQVIKIRSLRWIRRIVLYGGLTAIILVLFAFLLLQIPAVQNKLVKKYTEQFNKASGFEITFKDIYLLWFDRLEISGLKITDPENNTMIGIESLSVNYRFTSLLQNNDINIDGASIDSAEVNLVKIKESDTSRNLNFNIFINYLNRNATGQGSSPKVNIGEVILSNSHFAYNDSDQDSIKDRFDYFHFQLGVTHTEVQNFKVIGDTIQFKLNALQAVDKKSALEVKSMQTFFRISQSSLEFLDLNLKAGNSIVKDTLRFSYKKQSDLGDFNNKVTITANLQETIIYPEDLALFAPEVGQLKHPVLATGRFTGKVSRFNFKDMILKYGNTQLAGKLSMDGLPAFNETFITLQLTKSEADISDFKFAFTDNVYTRLRPLGKFNLDGTFTGFVNDFVANATMRGSIGTIQSDINLKINEQNIDQSTYRGNLRLADFNLGTFLSDTSTFQNVSLKGNINGRGLSASSADFLLSGQIFSLGILGYEYQNIKTNARLASQFFSGRVAVDDPNLKFNAEGSIDFRKGSNLVNVKAQLDSASLQPIGLTKDHLFVQTYIEINSHGLHLDSLVGEAILKNSYLEYKEKNIRLDSIRIISEQTAEERAITIRSSLVDVSLKGNYYYSTLFNDLGQLVKELSISLRNDKEAITEYYAQKKKSQQSYDAQFAIQLHDVNPLIYLTELKLALSKETQLNGRFTNGYASILQANSHIDTIYYNGKVFENNELELTGSKVRDSANVLALLNIKSSLQRFTPRFRTKNLSIEGVWNEEHINLNFDVDQDGASNFLRLRSEIDFLNDTTQIKILPSRVQALEKLWAIDEDNYILLSGKKIQIHQLQAQFEKQSILLDGIISDQSSETLKLTIEELDINILNTLSTETFSGILNGTVEARSLLHEPYVQNNLTVSNFGIDDFLIGDVHGTNEWNPEKKKFDINFFVDRLSDRTVNLTGWYDPAVATNPLNIEAKFNKANLKIVEPLLRDIFAELSGELSGTYTIRGDFSNPLIQGIGKINGGKVLIDYLKTLYWFDGELEMTPNQFIFNNFEITDVFNNRGSLAGYIAHKSFNKFRLNLDGTFTNLQVLNTTSKDNSLFYGQGYVTGNMNIFGPASNLKISATARTEKNTKIYIPISGTGEIEKKDFITFAHFTDSLTNATPVTSKKQTELTGITLDLNIDITPDAYAEIIFDIKAGDIIRGRGNGDIKLQLDTKGEFNMFGLIEFTEGAYNFTLFDIVNKEFYIKPGSRITWYGDPYQGTMNITAGYRQLSSLSPIYIDPIIAASPAIRRKYPLEVILHLENAMLSPSIKFDIKAIDLPDNLVVDGATGPIPVRLNFDFNAFLNKLDEQELMRQVFSLIVLRKLSPQDAFSTSGSFANSVSELLSNQLSYWLTQVDQNLEIDFDLDLGTMDQETFNTFQLRLSYSFLRGRLRITRDGTFASQNQAQQSVASLAGDWTVDYLLTPDGKFKIKMYSRSNVNAINASLGSQTSVTTGVSLLHTQNFNEVKDLLRFARERRRKEAEQQALEEEDQGGGTN